MATSGLLLWKKVSTTQLTSSMKGWKMINTQITPNTLKTKWANAARLACVFAQYERCSQFQTDPAVGAHN